MVECSVFRCILATSLTNRGPSVSRGSTSVAADIMSFMYFYFGELRVTLMRQNTTEINCLLTTCVYRPRSIKLNSCSIYFVYLCIWTTTVAAEWRQRSDWRAWDEALNIEQLLVSSPEGCTNFGSGCSIARRRSGEENEEP